MPRLITVKHCPHCKTELPQPTPRICVECGGSLQQRFLTAGCLTSAPKLLVFAVGAWWALRATL